MVIKCIIFVDMKWFELTQSQKADLMRIYLNNGISSLGQAEYWTQHYKEFYPSFAEGGNLKQDGTLEIKYYGRIE